jgi:hypothetical protein
MIFLAKRTTILATLLAGGIMGILAGPALPGAGERGSANIPSLWQNAVSDRQLAAWVESCVQQCQVTAAERRFDDIGWAKNIRDAERLAKKHNRPIFLFTYDGRMATGRC